MSNVLPIVLWYGGLIGVVLAALLVLWALALIAIKQSTALFAAGIMLAGLVLRWPRAGPSRTRLISIRAINW